MANLKDRVAVITGSRRGIGKAIALKFAAQGAKIVINDIVPAEEMNDVVEEIKALGSDAIAVQADVSDLEQATTLMKAATEQFDKIDILVNNAGITRDTLLMRMKPEDFDAVMNVNLRSAWVCSKAAIRNMMKKRYGRIINMSSVSGIMGNAGQTNYSASKAGVIGFTKALAREVANRNITVNAVAPGFVGTDLTKDLPKEITDQLNQFIPLGRWGTVDDVAHATAFLAAEESSYITGHVLVVDGGMAM